MREMTPRQRLTAALRREPVDRPPWTVDITYYNGAMRAQGRLDQKHEGMDGYLAQQIELGADPYFGYDCIWPWSITFEGVEHESKDEGSRHTMTRTLGGRSLVEVWQHLPESFCSAPVRRPVQTIQDLGLLLEMLRRGRMELHMEQHREMQAQWGERGLVCIGAPRTPIPALLAEWCGVTATTFLRADAPDLLAEVLEALDRLQDPIFEALAAYRPVAVHFCDNLTGEVVMPFWDRHMAPVYRRRLEQLHAAGIVCVVHNDGTMRGVLRKIAEVGFDGAESLTPAPVGDIAPEDLRAAAGREDFILWGMVPGASFAPPWTREQFGAFVARVLDACTGPMILGSADQIPPDGDIERVRIAADLLCERRRD